MRRAPGLRRFWLLPSIDLMQIPRQFRGINGIGMATPVKRRRQLDGRLCTIWDK